MTSNESKDNLLKKALIEIKKLKAKLSKDESIAVIGIGCRFPGGITNPEEFWEALIEQRNMISHIEHSRWSEYFSKDCNKNQYIKKAGFLKEDIMSFDNGLFRLSPKEAERTDPQQRLFMKVTWEALENAGYSPNSLKNSKTGVYAGITSTDYSNELCIDRKANGELQSGDIIGSSFSFLSGRVSYFFGFQGPGITIDTACSSSLVAIDNACKGLITGECNMAIAGGVNLMYLPETTQLLGELNILSPDCEIRSFDAKANGTVRGEGCGILVLKRLSDAEKDGDIIHAVIRGSGVNQDGPSSGLTAPYGRAQERLIKDILSHYEIKSSDVGYIEAHGTGTELGDPIEISALGNVFSEGRKSNLYVGTVKSNIGHLEAAAGVAGIIKVILAVKNGRIPGNLNFEVPSPHMNWEEIPIEIPKKTIEWKNEDGKKRIAGVSSFGLSGTNAHAIVEEYSSKTIKRKSELLCDEKYRYWPFKFSSNSEKGLDKQLEIFLEYLRKARTQQEVLISNLSYSQNICKADLKEKIVIWANSYSELNENINLALNNQINSNIKYGNSEKKVIFLFTGQGSQYPAMFKEFYDKNSIFKYWIGKCNTFYKEYTGNELLPIIFSSDNLINETKYTQSALFSVEYSLAQMWMEYGINPELMMGHSVGEYVAACLVGVFNLKDAIKLVTARGSLMQKLSVKGKMVAIFMKRNDVEELLRFKVNVSIAATNSEEQTIISGNSKEVDEICDELKGKGINSVLLKVSNAFHSQLMEPMIEDFEQISKNVQYNIPSKAIISNVTGGIIGKEIASWQYWSKHILSEVKFYQSIQSIESPENYVFLEIGPKPVLTSFVDSIYGEKAEVLVTNYPDIKTEEQIEKVIFDLYAVGSHIKWRKYYSNSNFNRIAVPNYKFSEKYFEINKVILISDNYNKAKSNSSILKEEYEDKEVREITSKLAGNKYSFQTVDEVKRYIRSELKRELKIDENELADDENLLLYGLNSIVTTRLAAMWRKNLKISLKPGILLENCSVNKWAEIVFEQATKPYLLAEEKKIFSSHPEKRYNSFSLSKVQNAYLVGRNNELEYGGVSCYGAYEIEIQELNLEKFKNALDLLVKRHDMLRCIISEDGTQKIKKEIELPLKIYRKSEICDIEKHLENLRKEISLQVIPLEKTMFDIRVTETNNNKWIIHFGIDFMIADALSISILWRNVSSFYFDKKLPNLEVTYKDYLNYELMSNNNSYELDKKYWLNKVDNFPNTPELPVNIKNGKSGGFSRRKKWIDNKTWQNFVTLAAEHNLTPSSALFCLYSEILSAWGGGEEFAVMLTVFNRALIHSQINQVIGDFTQLALVEVHRKNKTVGENALDFQIQMQKDIEHTNYSAIDFIKELNKNSDSERIYPIVFTSALGMEEMSNRDEPDIFGSNLESIASSTPQVWIDHQVFNEKEGVALSWDTLDHVFFPCAVESMFEQYVELVIRASIEKDFWKNTLVDLRPKNQKNIQEKSNNTFKPIKDSLLHENIINRALYYGEEISIVCDNKKYSYKQLIDRANQVSELLEREDVQKGDKIGLQMKKSFDQIAVIIGILQIGAVYIPLNYDQPANRTIDIIKRAGISILFVDESNEILNDNVKQINSRNFDKLDGKWNKREVTPSDLAYIIYTSGSTGSPKGVCIDHKSAMNTINDVNNRFEVTSRDSIFGLSSISFDLSVYDIFGILSVGGTLVLPTEEERIDPKCWKLLIDQYEVSIWNTVPALMKIYTDYIESVGINGRNYKIRRIILSGDWIPLNLPDKIKVNLPKAKLTSMGGATEASIWSNYYDVLEVNPEWNSIPYGYPLANQHFYILDEFDRHCPNWVKGKLFIGGKGLSEGYLNEEKLTEETYIYNTQIGEKIYNTGDYGRYTDENGIEFLGRKDSQIKINGYRIEIGEIESAFRKCGNFREVIILPIGNSMNKNKIVAFLKHDKSAVSEDKLKLMLKEYLPYYFIPERIILLDNFPVTLNGKIDRKELLSIFERQVQLIRENNELENMEDNPVLQTIREILNISELRVEDSFSNIGISSLEIIRLANQLEIIYTDRPLVSEMIKYKFVSELLDFYRNKIGENKIQDINHDNIVSHRNETIEISDEIQLKEKIDENYKTNYKKYNELNTNEYEKVKALEDRYNKLGIKLCIESGSLKFKAPKGIMTLEMRNELKDNKEKLITYLNEIENNRFPLTPIQLAYALGRSKDYELGNVSAHYYSEYECNDLDITKFEQAINKVIEKHEMLRTIIHENGTQEVLSSIPIYKIKYKQIVNVEEFEDTRNELSQCVYKLGEWPMFNIQVCRFKNESLRIYFSIDCLIADGWSTLLFLKEIFKAYHGIKIEKPEISIREYISKQALWLESKVYHSEASKFWQEQVNKLPPAPNIPLKTPYELIEKPHFSRKMFKLSKEESDIFNKKIKNYNFTASAVICTAYMKVLSHWSKQKDITLNLTLFNRLPLNKDIMKIIGDFTNITLIPYFQKYQDSFINEIEEIQNFLWKAIEYRTYNGLNLLRTLSKDTPGKAIMPIVFTSLLFGESIESYDEVLNNMKEIYSISQTPQVSLDHQVYEKNGSITFVWDYVEEAFEEEIINKMFNDYTIFIRKLIAEEDWNAKFYISPVY